MDSVFAKKSRSQEVAGSKPGWYKLLVTNVHLDPDVSHPLHFFSFGTSPVNYYD